MFINFFQKIILGYKLWRRNFPTRTLYTSKVDSTMVDHCAENINDFYKKFKHIVVNEHHNNFLHLAEQIIWCKTNCKKWWRVDLHRVISQIKIDDEAKENKSFYVFNDTQGHLVICFAFTSDEDYSWYQLRWL